MNYSEKSSAISYTPVMSFPIYGVDTNGNVINLKTNKILKQHKKYSRGSCYLTVDLYCNGIKKSILVHRLVAMTFIPNPNNHPQVNHIDENSLNNTVSNLEWCSAKYNCNYGNHIANCKKSLLESGKGWIGRKHREDSRRKMSASKIGKPSKRKRPVLINEKIEVASLTECASFLNISLTQVYNLINGKRYSNEYKIRYKEEQKICMNE